MVRLSLAHNVTKYMQINTFLSQDLTVEMLFITACIYSKTTDDSFTTAASNSFLSP